MAAGITDHFTEATNGTRPVPTTLTAIKAIGAPSITCNALTGWPTVTAVHFIIYNTNADGTKTANSQSDWKGIVSGNTITNLTLKAGTDNGYGIGAVVECAPTAAWADDMADGILLHANQDGSLIGSAVRTALNQSASVGSGWTTLGQTLNTITYNGNRNYTLVFNGVDLTPTLSNGMKLLLPRTVTAPTKSTSLNGTTQFYNNTSPAGMTFTNNFTCSAWIKLSSYSPADAVIVSRYNGTSGWAFLLLNTGQVRLTGLNGGVSNQSYIQSAQSIPLNKWVHVATQLDMATFTVSPTTSYVMIDGVDVAASVARSGTNPTALIQAGNLEIGSYNSGTGLFPGKLAQVAVYNAKVTQANIVATISQGLVGTESSLISAYSFNNSINDLNANANNLTAQGGAVATNADSPFAGGAAAATAYTAGTTEFGEIFNISFSTNTTVILQVPDGYAVPTTGGVGTVSYSSQYSPLGWPGPIVTLAYIMSMTNLTITAPTTATLIPPFTASPYIPAGRKVKITHSAGPGLTNSAGAAAVSFSICKSSAADANRIQQINLSPVAMSASTTSFATVEAIDIPASAGNQTYLGTTSAASGNVVVAGATVAPAFLLVELA